MGVIKLLDVGTCKKRDFLNDDLTIKADDHTVVMSPHDKSLRKKHQQKRGQSTLLTYTI